jgi:hypothetical protein
MKFKKMADMNELSPQKKRYLILHFIDYFNVSESTIRKNFNLYRQAFRLFEDEHLSRKQKRNILFSNDILKNKNREYIFNFKAYKESTLEKLWEIFIGDYGFEYCKDGYRGDRV